MLTKMKNCFPRVIAMMSILLILTCLFAACGGEKTATPTAGDFDSTTTTTQTPAVKFTPDVKIEDFAWTVSEDISGGKVYVLMEVENNSAFVVKKFNLDFTEKATISKAEKDAFYADIQKSQGFDDAWMSEYVKSREELNQPIAMYGNCEKELSPSQKSEKIKCYYLGGLTSKEVLHSDLFVPDKAEIEYVKDGADYTIIYDFQTKKYELKE